MPTKSKYLPMADGLNQARAMRVAEIMSDYRNLQNYIAAIRANPSADAYNEDGFVVLRRCVAESQALLQQPFNTTAGSTGDPEQDRMTLRRIIVDASIRRFKAQKIYLRAAAALRWVNARSQLLQGRAPDAGHAAALQQLRTHLRTELASITNARVEALLRARDTQEGKWLAEDPPLNVIERVLANDR